MKEITDPIEIERMRQDLFGARSSEQKQKKDYAYLEDGSIETCGNCGTPLNSHDHCPLCDY